MEKEPERRWPTAAAFADAVEHALASGGRRAPSTAPVLATGGGRRGRVAALAALAACALAAGIAVGAGSTGGSRPARASAGGRATAHSTPPATHPQTTHAAAKSQPAAPTHTASAPAAAAVTAPPSADALQTRGHALMEAGNYTAAIPVLRQAVANASPGSLTYAYALYDLGRSLRLAGDPQAAIPILQRRLAIPNQTGVVRAELQLALQAAGERPADTPPQTSGGGAPAPPDGKHGRRHGHGPSGGAAFPQNGGG